MFQTKVVEQIKAHILHSITFFENRAVSEIMWKNAVESSRPHDNLGHAYCMLDTEDYKHTFTLCNTYCFSTVIIFA